MAMAWRGHGYACSCGFCCARGCSGVAMAEVVDVRGIVFGGGGGEGVVARTGGCRSMNFKLKLKQA